MSNKEITEMSFNDIKDDDDIIKKIEDEISLAFDYDYQNNEKYKEDLSFALGNMWESNEIGEFVQRNKVCLTVNVLYSAIMQILAEQRQNSPQIQVRALEKNVDQKVINLYEGLLRKIAYDSSSDIAYQTAYANALLGGKGVLRLVIEYENPKSFQKKIRIEAIKDPVFAYFDPNAKHVTKMDGEYAGIYTKMPISEFKEKYPDIDNPESFTPPSTYNYDFKWNDGETITICEHMQKIWKKTTLYKLSNGDTVTKDEYDDHMKELRKMEKQKENFLNMMWEQHTQTHHMMMPASLKNKLLPKIKIEEERQTEIATIKHYKLVKGHILEEAEIPGSHILFCYVDGRSQYIDGKQIIKSFIADAKDAQKLLNFVYSEIAQGLKTGRKGTFMATDEQIGPYKELWRNPERASAALIYKPDAKVPGGAPTYIPPTELSQSVMQSPAAIIDMIQHITGRYESSRGMQGNEMSGIAIANRAKQGNLSVFIFQDNLNRAIEEINKVMLELIPNLYTDRKQIEVRGKDGKMELMDAYDGDESMLRPSSLDVTVSIGASFEMQKMDAFNQMMSFVQLNPQAFSTLLADLLAQNTNLDNTPQIVDRLRNFVVPPNVIAQEEGKPMPPTPPNPQQIAMQQEAQARLLEAQAKIAKVQTDGQVAQVKAQSEMGKANLDYQGQLVKTVTDAKHHAVQAENQNLKEQLARAHQVIGNNPIYNIGYNQ